MSLLGDAFNGFINWVASQGSSPSNNAQNPAPSGGGNTGGGGGSTFDLIGGIAQIAGPLLTTAVSRPKPLPLPEQPKFPKVPDSVANDPRVKQLLGAYGFPDNMPSIQPQKLSRPSAFQLAFPAMFNAAMSVYGDYRTSQQTTNNNQTTTPTATSPTATTATAMNAINQANRVFPITNPQQTIASDGQLDAKIGTKYTQNYDAVRQYDDLVNNASQQHGIDANLLRAVMLNESGGDASAVGDNGKSFGLMQIQLPVARNLTKNPNLTAEELRDPAMNISTAALFLKELSKKYDNDYDKILGAYNAGEPKFDKGIYNPKYIAKARKNYLELARIYGNSAG